MISSNKKVKSDIVGFGLEGTSMKPIPVARKARFGMNKEDVSVIRQILEESDDRTHMGIALAIINAGFTRVSPDNTI